MGELSRIVELLGPGNGTVCVGCGEGEKAEGEILCGDCSGFCPDDDCRAPLEPGTRRALKGVDEEVCRYCASWRESRDLECQGRLGECSVSCCRRAGCCLGFSKLIPRFGFFVYQLDTGYVGMTYDPSRRQLEHGEFADCKAGEIASHWRGVRRSDVSTASLCGRGAWGRSEDDIRRQDPPLQDRPDGLPLPVHVLQPVFLVALPFGVGMGLFGMLQGSGQFPVQGTAVGHDDVGFSGGGGHLGMCWVPGPGRPGRRPGP